MASFDVVDLPVQSSLDKIRRLIQSHDDDETMDELVFHRIFVCFNTLIASVVHEYIVNLIAVDDHRHRPMVSTTTLQVKRHKRGLSSDINETLAQTWTMTTSSTTTSATRVVDKTIPTPVQEGQEEEENEKETVQKQTGKHSPSTAPSNQSGPINNVSLVEIKAETATPDIPPSSSKEDNYHSPTTTAETFNETFFPKKVVFSENSFDRQTREQNNDVDDDDDDDDDNDDNQLEGIMDESGRVQRLLNLLTCFVQLKESTGVERAILSSLLVLTQASSSPDRPDSSSRLFNDLILEVENQRNLVAQLENLPSGPLRNLVLELAQLSPTLLELQNKILMDFQSLKTDDYDSEKIWNTITIYIDKLHSLELLIVEELESALPESHHNIHTEKSRQYKHQQGPQQPMLNICEEEPNVELRHALEAVFPPSNGLDLISQLESMSSDALKASILKQLKAGLADGEITSEVDDSKSSEGSSRLPRVSNQYTSDQAVNLNRKMEKALRLERLASKEWGIDIYEIKFQKRIGQGASGTTYLASWTGQQVAVKVASITEFGLEGWRTEVQALQKLHHPNIIRLLGSIYHQNPLTYCLVLEYCNAGNLATALKYPTPRNFFFHVSTSIANAMTYLHSRRIIHRDLKPGNVLCDGSIASGNFVVKVTDFGVATEDGEWPETQQPIGGPGAVPRNLTGETGTYRWMAPEVVRHEAYSYMADSYSFAIMVWQFLTHEEPYSKMRAEESAVLVAAEGLRPPMPEMTPKTIRELVESNWSDDPKERWKFERMAATLNEIQESLTPEERAWLEEAHGHPVYTKRQENNETQEENKGKNAVKIGRGGQKQNAGFLGGIFGGGKKK